MLRPALRVSRACCRCYATGTNTTPPMLLKIRKDLKSAMQAKDTPRLLVLRSLLSSTLNASKTNSPITTDLQMLALLRKTANASKAASLEFRGAGREDLADKEDGQIKIMEEYAGEVETVSEAEVESVVKATIEQMGQESKKPNMGDVLKRIFDHGAFGEKAVEKGEVAKVVKRVLAEN